MNLKIEIPISDELVEEAKYDPELQSYLVKRLAFLAKAELEALLAG